MGWIVFFGSLVVLISIIPIMVAARIFNAKRTGFLTYLVAAIAFLVIGAIAVFLTPSRLWAVVFSIPIAALCFSFILDASYIKSVCIAVLSLVFQVAIALFLSFLRFIIAPPVPVPY